MPRIQYNMNFIPLTTDITLLDKMGASAHTDLACQEIIDPEWFQIELDERGFIPIESRNARRGRQVQTITFDCFDTQPVRQPTHHDVQQQGPFTLRCSYLLPGRKIDAVRGRTGLVTKGWCVNNEVIETRITCLDEVVTLDSLHVQLSWSLSMHKLQ